MGENRKVLIVYASKYGATRAAAQKLAEALDGDVQLLDLEGKERTSPGQYDTVVVGGPIYAGMLRKSVKQYCRQYEGELLKKRLGVFVCCAYSGGEAQRAIQENFSEGLLVHAAATGLFGGTFQLEKMNFLERKILQMVQKNRGEDVLPALDEGAIEAFAQEINE